MTTDPPRRHADRESQPISDLAELLRTMRPRLRPGVWVYCRLQTGTDSPRAVAIFHEDEGLTGILPEAEVRRLGLQPFFRAAWITLTVHSDLNAVGFLAAISRALADAGIGCNVVSAVHHDHLFVPHERAADALAVLEDLTRHS
jgi:hypothetical protein